MKVAALQLGPAGSTIAETADRIVTLVRSAAAGGVVIGVLPELALTPYFAAEIHDSLDLWADENENKVAVSRIASAAAESGMAIIIPFAERSGGALYNSMAFVDTSGRHVGTFRKMHIPGHVEPQPDAKVTILEKRYFKAGDNGFDAYDIGPVKAGGLICYDRRFPESYRSLANNGAELICVGYNTPVMPGGSLRQSRRASELAICGGAYSTGTYAIAAGKAGRESGMTYIGGSFVCDAGGMIIAKARTNGDEAVIAGIDLEKQASVRKRWDFARNRRPGDYVLVQAS
jgi:predicted amidohydrolase